MFIPFWKYFYWLQNLVNRNVQIILKFKYFQIKNFKYIYLHASDI